MLLETYRDWKIFLLSDNTLQAVRIKPTQIFRVFQHGNRGIILARQSIDRREQRLFKQNQNRYLNDDGETSSIFGQIFYRANKGRD